MVAIHAASGDNDMSERKIWVKPIVKQIKAGSAETNVTGSQNDGGTGQDPKRRS